MDRGENFCSLVSTDFTLVSLGLRALFFSFSLPFFPSLFHLFTHLLEEGHNEISISVSREKAVCLLLSVSYHLHPSFIFLIIHSMKVILRDMPVCLFLSVPVFACLLPLYMPFCMGVVILLTQIAFTLWCYICVYVGRHGLVIAAIHFLL